MIKGAPARESRTGTWLVSPAAGRQKKKMTPQELGLKPSFLYARTYFNNHKE